MKPFTADELKTILNLAPLPAEGGYYFETYRATGVIPEEALPGVYKGSRAYSTAIYFLLTPDTFSAMHRLPTDEVFHFYLGDPVEMLQIAPDGTDKKLIMGPDLRNGQTLQLLVPGDHWQGARLVPGGEWALLGTTVAPGFEFADYEHGKREALLKEYPSLKEMITSLTRL